MTTAKMPDELYVLYMGTVLETPIYVTHLKKSDARDPEKYHSYTRSDLIPTPAPQVDADEYTIANLVMFIQRLARKLGATDKAAAQALEFIERKKLGGSVLRQDTLPQPPQEE